jgi:DNA-binding PadR family transcriptional regulator
MATSLLERELKRGSIEVLILALLDQRQRHGYEISQLIEERSNGTITFHTASLYPTLYRLEGRGLIEGRWVERAGQRRRRYYRLTTAGRQALTKQRSSGTRSSGAEPCPEFAMPDWGSGCGAHSTLTARL